MGKLSDLFVKLRLDNKQYNSELKESGKKTSTFGKGISKIGGLIAGAFAVGQIVSFGKELLELGGVAEGVRAAFNRIGDDKLLNDMKLAVAGTVSELELMKRAVMAHNFKIPVEQLATLFKFATKRAQETGESVDYLVNSIVLGIGRKSPLILDNLGISAVELRQKLEGVGHAGSTVGDVAKAVGEIAAESMAESGEIIDTNAIKVAALKAQWEDFKLALAEDPVISDKASNFLDATKVELTVLTSDLNIFRKAWLIAFGDIEKAASDINKLNSERKKSTKHIDEESEAYRNQIAAEQDAALEKRNHVKTINELRAETEALIKSIGDYGVNQEAEIQKTLRQIQANKDLIKELTTLKRTQDAAVPDKIKGKGTPSFENVVAEEGGLQDMSGFIERQKASALATQNEINDAILAQEQAFVDDMNGMMAAGMADFISVFAEGIGRLASGDIGFDQFFQAILGQIGGFLIQFGSMLISYGIAESAFMKAWNPGVKIAAGAALVAIGGAISGLASKGPQGYSGAGGGTQVTSRAVTGGQGVNDQDNGQQLVAVLKGDDLYISNERNTFKRGVIG